MGKIIGFLGGYKYQLIGAVLALGLLFIAFKVYIASIKHEAYNNGVVAERKIWNKKIDEENARNRAFESTLRNIITDYGENAVREAAARIKTETVYIDRIKTQVLTDVKYKECLVDENIIEARNSIRANGPTGIKSVTRTSEGTIRMEF